MNIAADGISFRKHSLQDTTPRRKDLRGYSIQLSAYGDRSAVLRTPRGYVLLAMLGCLLFAIL